MNNISEQKLNRETGGAASAYRHKDQQKNEEYLYHHRDEIAAQVSPEKLRQ